MTRLRKLLKDVKPKTRKKYGLFFVVAVVLMTLVFIAIEESDSVQKKYLYPYPYQDLVEAYAAANGVDSALVASVIMNESKFKSDVHSHRGAIGLMQIMPEDL